MEMRIREGASDPGAGGQPLQFVLFYAFRDAAAAASAGEIALLARSVFQSYPEASVVLLSNVDGATLGLGAAVRVVPRRVETTDLMVERLAAYRDWLAAAEPGATLVFMDTDMLVLRRFDELLAPGADLAVSVRREPRWPINAGLVVARVDEHGAVLAFFEQLAAGCAALPENERRWYGDQVALARLLRPTPGRFRRTYTEHRGDLTVRFAPALFYNQTPRPWMLRLGIFRGGARILHFKGNRKQRMGFYARLYLSRPLQAFLQGRRTPGANR